MGKLIDADKLREQIKKFYPTRRKTFEEKFLCITLDTIIPLIDEAPDLSSEWTWFKPEEKMPEEKEYFVGGNNYLDGKDRKWTESEVVLVQNDMGYYFTDSTKNGSFVSEKVRDCDGFPHHVVAWMPIPKGKCTTVKEDVDLEKEIDRLWEDGLSDELSGPHNIYDICKRLARHFYELGKKGKDLSLRPQLYWKPTKEQLSALQVAAIESKTDFVALTSLLVDLKKILQP